MNSVTMRFCSAAMAVALAMSSAFAQQVGRIRGQIEKIDGASAVLRTRDGSMMNIKIADDARVSALVKSSLDDIKDDTFIGVAGMQRPDGSIDAYSVHIFLPAQRGVVPDRFGPWDGHPKATMTNAYVTAKVAGKDGAVLSVKYKDGEKKIVVTRQTAITAVAPGSKTDLTAGAQIIIFASERQADGSTLAKVMYVGRGLTPAM